MLKEKSSEQKGERKNLKEKERNWDAERGENVKTDGMRDAEREREEERKIHPWKPAPFSIHSSPPILVSL